VLRRPHGYSQRRLATVDSPNRSTHVQISSVPTNSAHRSNQLAWPQVDRRQHVRSIRLGPPDFVGRPQPVRARTSKLDIQDCQPGRVSIDNAVHPHVLSLASHVTLRAQAGEATRHRCPHQPNLTVHKGRRGEQWPLRGASPPPPFHPRILRVIQRRGFVGGRVSKVPADSGACT
jgi:hypothetical protein